MKQIFVMCALLLGVCAANAQETDRSMRQATTCTGVSPESCLTDKW